MKQAPYIAVLSKSGKGCHVHVCVTTPTHVARGRKTLQTYGSSMQTYGETLFRGVNQQSPPSNF